MPLLLALGLPFVLFTGESLFLAVLPAIIHCCYSWRLDSMLWWAGEGCKYSKTPSLECTAGLYLAGSLHKCFCPSSRNRAPPPLFPQLHWVSSSVLSVQPCGPSPRRLRLFLGEGGGLGWMEFFPQLQWYFTSALRPRPSHCRISLLFLQGEKSVWISQWLLSQHLQPAPEFPSDFPQSSL